jgi:hypothetical protein
MHDGSDSPHTDDPMADVPDGTQGGGDSVADPSPPVEADLPPQDPPPGYEQQVDLSPDQNRGVTERDGATVSEVDSEVDDSDEADADDDDDAAEDGEPGDDS